MFKNTILWVLINMDFNKENRKLNEIQNLKKNEIIKNFANKFLEIYTNFSAEKKTFLNKHITNKKYQKKLIRDFVKFSKEKITSKEDSITYGKLMTKLLKAISILNLTTEKTSEEKESKQTAITSKQFHDMCKKINEQYNELIKILQKDYKENTTLIMKSTDSLMTGTLSQKKLIISDKSDTSELIYSIDFKKNTIEENSIQLSTTQIPKFESTYKKFAKYLENEKVKFSIK